MEIRIEQRKPNTQAKKRSKKDINEKTTEIIMNTLGIGETMITPNANFDIDLWADKDDSADMLLNCQSTFDISIYHTEEDAIRTVQELIECINGIISAEERIIE